MSDSVADFLTFAHTLADVAAQETLPRFRTGIGIEDKGALGNFDPVTEADRSAETIIRQRIKELYPTHGLLGEEHGFEPGADAFTWVIDPIDGTRAFISGIPLWTTLIALSDGHKPVLGMIDQPYMGERFFGSAAGAFLTAQGKTRPLATRKSARLRDAIFSATSPGLFHTPQEVEIHDKLVLATRLARYGCDAYAYALLAAGTIDLVVEPGLKPWDVQAFMPVIEAAGGIVARLDGGNPQDGGTIVAAANQTLFDECMALIKTP